MMEREDGVMKPKGKECENPLEAGKGKGQIPS